MREKEGERGGRKGVCVCVIICSSRKTGAGEADYLDGQQWKPASLLLLSSRVQENYSIRFYL